MSDPSVGYDHGMKIFRLAATIGIAKKLYDESRKPENQRRIKQGLDVVRAHRAKNAGKK